MKNSKKTIAHSILPELINSMYRNGILNDFDFENKGSFFEKIKAYLDKTEFEFIVDHRKSILEIAEQQFKNGYPELSITLFATYIEHTLNKIIQLECEYKKIDSKTTVEIIKNVNIVGKCTWLLKILGLPQFKIEYLKTITKISEERNAYIHYKWKPEQNKNKATNLTKGNIKKNEKYLEIKKLLKYLSNYETRHEFKGQKSKIINTTK